MIRMPRRNIWIENKIWKSSVDKSWEQSESNVDFSTTNNRCQIHSVDDFYLLNRRLFKRADPAHILPFSSQIDKPFSQQEWSWLRLNVENKPILVIHCGQLLSMLDLRMVFSLFMWFGHALRWFLVSNTFVLTCFAQRTTDVAIGHPRCVDTRHACVNSAHGTRCTMYNIIIIIKTLVLFAEDNKIQWFASLHFRTLNNDRELSSCNRSVLKLK